MASGGAQRSPRGRSNPVLLRRLREEDWGLWRELRLAALAEAPDAFSATLAAWTGEGDKEERWRARLLNVPFNLVAELQGRPMGMVSCTQVEDGEAELISMWVAPGARERGVGKALIAEVARWAAAEGADRLVLSVRTDNEAAVRLYARAGFTDDGPPTADPVHPPERRMARNLAAP